MTRDATLDAASLMVVEQDSKPSGTTAAAKLTPTCLKRIFRYLSRSDLARAALTCRAWSTPALELVWANFKFVREREFERVFSIVSRRNASRPYGTYVKTLDLVHADREFHISPNIILLVTSLCPNLESISITFHHTRPVAPPVPLLMQNRPVLPPIRRPGEPNPPPRLPVAAPRAPVSNNNNNNNNNNNAINNHPPPPSSPPHAHPHSPHQQQQQPQQHATRQYNHSLPLAHFAHNCRKLRSIRLTSYSPKTDDSVYEMAKYMKSGVLETIVFTGCATLQGSTLCKLAMTNPRLRHIEINGNTPVSDSSLVTLAERCGAHIENLSIGNAYHLSDASIRHVAKRCTNLRQLVMFNNADGSRLSEATLTELLQQCSKLKVLSLSNARSLGNVFFEAAVDRVRRELRLIEHGEAPSDAGLQRMCLGGVRREVIQGPAVMQLIKMSATENGEYDEDEDGNDENGDSLCDPLMPSRDQALSHLMGDTTHMPKTTVVRGSSIWWQRQRATARRQQR